jgi:hypothetical protein
LDLGLTQPCCHIAFRNGGFAFDVVKLPVGRELELLRDKGRFSGCFLWGCSNVGSLKLWEITRLVRWASHKTFVG